MRRWSTPKTHFIETLPQDRQTDGRRGGRRVEGSLVKFKGSFFSFQTVGRSSTWWQHTESHYVFGFTWNSRRHDEARDP